MNWLKQKFNTEEVEYTDGALSSVNVATQVTVVVDGQWGAVSPPE